MLFSFFNFVLLCSDLVLFVIVFVLTVESDLLNKDYTTDQKFTICTNSSSGVVRFLSPSYLNLSQLAEIAGRSVCSRFSFRLILIYVICTIKLNYGCNSVESLAVKILVMDLLGHPKYNLLLNLSADSRFSFIPPFLVT